MENSEKSQSRPDDDSNGLKKSAPEISGGDIGQPGSASDSGKGTESPAKLSPEGSGEAADSNDDGDIDPADLGISPEHQTSSIYRRAFSLYDPGTMEVQLSEHYFFTDGEFERNGHF